jgi:hypothetical protein
VKFATGVVVALNPVWAARFDRYAQLQFRSDSGTVALFLKPLGSARCCAPRIRLPA